MKVSVLSLGMWVVGVEGRDWDSLAGGVLFMLEQVVTGVLFMSVGWAGVM